MLTALISDLTKVHVFKKTQSEEQVLCSRSGQVYPGPDSDKFFPTLFSNLLAV